MPPVAPTVHAWDLPTRVFKWALVALVVAAPLTKWYGDVTLAWHRLVGYSILTLILWRVLWGFTGGATARWRSFLKWPWTAARYGRDLVLGRKRYYLGHNPLGAWMILALLAVLTAQAVTGLFATDDIVTDGPLKHLVAHATSKTLTGIHDTLPKLLLALVVLHVLANVVYTLRGEPLISAMITGKKPAGAYEDLAENQEGSILRALGLLIVAAAVVFGGLWVFGQSAFA